MARKFLTTSPAPQKKWYVYGKLFSARSSDVAPRENFQPVHGTIVEIVGMPRASDSSPTASAASESKHTTRSHFSRSTSSLPTTLERLGSDWLSLTTSSTVYDLPPTFSPSFSFVRTRSIIQGVVSPKLARTPDWAPMKPILSVRDWALATCGPVTPAAPASPRRPPVLRNARRLTVPFVSACSRRCSVMATSFVGVATENPPP